MSGENWVLITLAVCATTVQLARLAVTERQKKRAEQAKARDAYIKAQQAARETP